MKQVSCQSICWRYFLLFRGHDLRGRGDSWASDKNFVAALLTASDQLYLLDPSAVQDYSLPSTSFTTVWIEVNTLGNFLSHQLVRNRVNLQTGLLEYSRFPCKSNEYVLFKVKSTDEEVPNCTVICLVLRVLGPLHERTLCTVLLVCDDLWPKFQIPTIRAGSAGCMLCRCLLHSLYFAGRYVCNCDCPLEAIS